MKPIPLTAFAEIVDGSIPPSQPFPVGAAITGFATDNRDVRPGDLFIAIKGAKVDGHDFAADAIGRGAVAVLVEHPVEVPHIQVDNVVGALAKLGAHYRDRFSGPVIGVTGSAGKTTTKEFIAAALSPLGRVLKTEGNRNTEYTAPLLWPEVEPNVQAVIVEMAMRGQGQIAHLASFSKPTLGVVTNIGFSHLSELGSQEAIAKAKSELLLALPQDGVAILPSDDDYFPTLRNAAGSRQVYSFGSSDSADCRIIGYRAIGWEGSVIDGFFADIPWQAHIPYLGRHLARNVAAAITVAAALGLAPQEAADALPLAAIPPMRMQVLERNGAKILLDAYNASPASMREAIETFLTLPAPGRKLLILGQMNELGDVAATAHRDLIEFATSFQGTEVHTFGPLWAESGIPVSERSLDDLRMLVDGCGPGDAILIKGSRSLELERVIA